MFLTADAAAFVPKSRARVFLFGHKGGLMLPEPPPARDDLRLAEVAEWDGDWWPAPRLGAFLTAMSVIQSERVTSYQRREVPGFFGVYRRTRDGRPVWEVRADERAPHDARRLGKASDTAGRERLSCRSLDERYGVCASSSPLWIGISGSGHVRTR